MSYLYDAVGTLIASNAAPQTDYFFAGEQGDPHLGLDYLRARYLNPGTGRLWTRDTHPGGNQDPVSLHRYPYASADPVNRVDPSENSDFIQMLTVKSIQLGFFTARRVAQHPKEKRSWWSPPCRPRAFLMASRRGIRRLLTNWPRSGA